MLAALAVVTALLWATLGRETPRAEPAELTVLNWNVCGEAGGRRGEPGYCPLRNRPDRKVAAIRDLATRHDADVITLQEVCGGAAGSHLALLEEALGSGWTVVRARGTRPDGSAECRGGLRGTLGLGIAVRGKVTSSSAVDTLSDGAAAPGAHVKPLLCVDVEGRPYRVCTTHLLPGSDERGRAQAARIARHASPDGRPYVLTGDFNRDSASSQLAPLTGVLDECPALRDRPTHHAWNRNRRTHGFRTLDHVFAGPRTGGATAEFLSCGVDATHMDTTPNEPHSGPAGGLSDHAPVHATIRFGR
ncbi:endonuclease/exonuclease/phosphatase family protein [Streptomyces tritici]|uniref:endonuclease/exonuclease/phosphatase family protein n=1 Tax=Streptomyces tritici TaxID=2054410 RepID=UPI003AF18967